MLTIYFFVNFLWDYLHPVMVFQLEMFSSVLHIVTNPCEQPWLWDFFGWFTRTNVVGTWDLRRHITNKINLKNLKNLGEKKFVEVAQSQGWQRFCKLLTVYFFVNFLWDYLHPVMVFPLEMFLSVLHIVTNPCVIILVNNLGFEIFLVGYRNQCCWNLRSLMAHHQQN